MYKALRFVTAYLGFAQAQSLVHQVPQGFAAQIKRFGFENFYQQLAVLREHVIKVFHALVQVRQLHHVPVAFPLQPLQQQLLRSPKFHAREVFICVCQQEGIVQFADHHTTAIHVVVKRLVTEFVFWWWLLFSCRRKSWRFCDYLICFRSSTFQDGATGFSGWMNGEYQWWFESLTNLQYELNVPLNDRIWCKWPHRCSQDNTSADRTGQRIVFSTMNVTFWLIHPYFTWKCLIFLHF